MASYAEPAHPPPAPPRRTAAVEADADDLGDAEPPPPYTSVATGASTTLEANFSRPYEVQDSGAFAQSQSASGPSGFAHPTGAPPQHPHRTGASSSSSTGFMHPPGPPPPPQRANGAPQPSPHIDGVSSFNRPALPNQAPAHTTAAPPMETSREYSPTVRPCSGQPLLNRGRLLIYTNGFYCPKCHNTGYKAYDPSNPHDRCWEKYGKQFTAVIRNSPNFTFSNPALQKPLPNVRYTAALPPAPPPPQHQHPGYFIAGQQGGPPPLQFQPPPQQHHYPGAHYQNNGGMMAAQPHVSHMTGWGPPPPGALVVRPGDPRIGGRMCYNCGGRGVVDCGFLFLDEETCRMCNGTGRVF